ncbi:glycosyltransferase family protein [Nodularia spumigena]|uniref:glycosyltransferase family protein n=1 Tax=Nodularia spumigena TaxID=70799 RepID=UPI002330A1CC|nr:glycosyltransferase family protein [Nodularia spumigena]MDB9316485.1 glycosyltransferase family protein [Nodularia spumigena CS-590/01A]MDB9322218.1 glycosyltransferase family protein [Nodularia spumigena CS-591/07A]MDB9324845.1 glycosyltransferase family protein [Nodularia spumigena CS-590/02]MDB9329134.1 glycosyltransferase family protein [Nodularia spumigena CS-591/04]MDB9335160.1 glycosyltransferase family protein [Nodularia spumigena CS-590/01]
MNNLLPHSGEITRTSANVASSEVSHLSTNARKWRIALYSHDTMGLGHKRRNLLIAQTLGCSPLEIDVLMISGIQDVSNVPTPPGVDCLTLPALHKNIDGQYQARRWDLSLPEIITLRSQVILTTIQAFKPDIFIVDNVPRGAVRELDPTLDYLRTQGKTRCILGLRDILDEPASVGRDWQRGANEEAIQTYYDAVWVYGDPAIYDLAQEYRFAAKTLDKIRYTGYLDQRSRLKFIDIESVQAFKSLNLPSERLALCLVGGGQDGAVLAEAFAHAQLPPEMNGIILTGPFMPRKVRQQLQNYAAKRGNLRVLEYLAEPTLLLNRAERVITMGGYNTTCELLSFQKRSLIIPRIKPRKEQLIRAERLQKLGLVDMLHPCNLTSQALTDWLMQAGEPPQTRNCVDLNGLTRILQFVDEILMSAHHSSPQAS